MNKKELEAKLRKSNREWWDKLPIGRENMYRCPTGHYIITIDLDRGVTPAFMRCREEGCDNEMISAGYPTGPRPPHLPQPGWEWYRPEANALGRFGDIDEVHEYIVRGGLNIRKREVA
jgi:hypothetical protein